MKIQKTVNIKNKRATFDYEIIERMVAGISLVGTEIKSIRLGKANLSDSFCYFERSELYVRNLSISEYDYGTHYNHIAKRERKLLLQKKEIRKWERKIKETGLTIIPLRLFINDRGFAKMEIGLAKGKKTYDKRETLRLKDAKREMDRSNKH
ncbi:SsrA-binding protein SmpB [Halosquirtibacter laminarini]|uniref:SsrA-binding protein SmpB n=1 Tax=Halosquirtibacter laminarini TaxID=3374600 RepID=A0AC61NLL2_9BACT|nr:SsrA-binding protein SmpB [Prolixibacteraceae bacterium]